MYDRRAYVYMLNRDIARSCGSSQRRGASAEVLIEQALNQMERGSEISALATPALNR
jgi:hypothetical protein